MFTFTVPKNVELFAMNDSTISLLWTALSVSPTFINLLYKIDKNGPKLCPYHDGSRKQAYCSINDLEVYTEYQFSLMLCDQPLLDNKTRCTSPSIATQKTLPQSMFKPNAYFDSSLHLKADFKLFEKKFRSY